MFTIKYIRERILPIRLVEVGEELQGSWANVLHLPTSATDAPASVVTSFDAAGGEILYRSLKGLSQDQPLPTSYYTEKFQAMTTSTVTQNFQQYVKDQTPAKMAISWIKDQFTALKESLGYIFKTVIDAISGAISAAFNFVKGLFRSGSNKISSKVDTATTTMWGGIPASTWFVWGGIAIFVLFVLHRLTMWFRGRKKKESEQTLAEYLVMDFKPYLLNEDFSDKEKETVRRAAGRAADLTLMAKNTDPEKTDQKGSIFSKLAIVLSCCVLPIAIMMLGKEPNLPARGDGIQA